jgi:4a-hydroxytetrahydrobiopterin dehydratase
MATPKSNECDAWPPLSADEIATKMNEIVMWKIEAKGQPPKLIREFVCKNFQSCLDFVALAGACAEERGHHPDLLIHGYRNIKITIYSHGLQALTDNDFNLAKAIDTIQVNYSPKFYKEHPECDGTKIP